MIYLLPQLIGLLLTPTTFRINLKNNENFYLVHTSRTFIAEVEGKKYYLLNLNEQQNAQKAIARILRYGAPNIEGEVDASEFDTGSSGGGSDEESVTDITVDTETDVDA